MTEKSNPKLEAALLYLSLGWSVIPLHSVVNGKCTCGNPDCGHSSGKHPRISWAEFQTRRATEGEIRTWWRRWPNANPGIATGAISGVIVLDVDEPRGVDTLRERRLAVPPGVRQQTGGGGYQYIFRHPGFECRNFAGKIGHTILPNIDFRGDGGLVVLPPGDHLSGGVYEWIVSPKDDQIKDAPDWLLDLIKGQMSATGNQGPDGQGAGLTPADWHKEVPEGQRKAELTRIAGSLLYRMSAADAWPMISAWNQEHCRPPLQDDEIETIITSIAKKEAGKQKRKPFLCSNLSTAFIKPRLPSSIKSKSGIPKYIYLLEMLITRRRFPLIMALRACSSPLLILLLKVISSLGVNKGILLISFR